MNKNKEILNYAIRVYGKEDAMDLNIVGRSLWRKGYSLEEIAEAYNVMVEDLRINTMTTEESVKTLYKIGWETESIAFVANKSIEWVKDILINKEHKRVKVMNSGGFKGLSMAAKTAY